MRSIVFSREADSDLLKIYRYTIHKWGVDQAKHYKNQLQAALVTLAQSPSLVGRIHDGLPTGYYLYRAQHHLIIFRFTDKQLDIARILHEKMDITLHKVP